MTHSNHTAQEGICAACMHEEFCVYRVIRGIDPVYCELFDSFPGAPGERRCEVAEPAESEYASLQGLCVNCAKRYECSLPHPSGGVWHCEDYC